MTRYAAFLRGVNLGKRTVKSADLVAAFADMGLKDVRTLIASGNVLFDSGAARGTETELAARIELGLEKAFGFDIGTVLRSMAELEAMIAADPFRGEVEGEAQKLYVTLFAAPEAERLTLPCALPGDFEVVGVRPREIFHIAWRKPDGRFSVDTQNIIWKPFGKQVLWTNRNWNTILKAVAPDNKSKK